MVSDLRKQGAQRPKIGRVLWRLFVLTNLLYPAALPFWLHYGDPLPGPFGISVQAIVTGLECVLFPVSLVWVLVHYHGWISRNLSFLGRPVFILPFGLLVFAFPYGADAKVVVGTSFTEQCPALFAEADNFAKECLGRARKSVRDFYPASPLAGAYSGPDREVHGAYFRPAAPGSHFALGCTLNRKHEINFLGVYYSTNGDNFKIANTAPISFVDFQGNVGLSVGKDRVTLLAVRQFGTDLVPLRYPDGMTVKNCEPSILPDGAVNNMSVSLRVREYQDGDKTNVNTCIGVTEEDLCHTHEYISFFKSNRPNIIGSEMPEFWLIGDGGDFLVEKKIQESSCRNKEKTLASGSPHILNILTELCSSGHQL
jgi:hypothetical protein